MPLREYKCSCGKVREELYKQGEDYPKTIKCECGKRANYCLGRTTFKFQFWDGYDLAAGEHFNSQKERDNWLVNEDHTYREVRS